MPGQQRSPFPPGHGDWPRGKDVNQIGPLRIVSRKGDFLSGSGQTAVKWALFKGTFFVPQGKAFL